MCGYLRQIRLRNLYVIKTRNSYTSNRSITQSGRGYDAYDLVRYAHESSRNPTSRLYQWDLGEFNQKGTVKTRWGTKEEYLSACKVAQEHGIQITVDAVLNVSLIFLYFSMEFGPEFNIFFFRLA